MTPAGISIRPERPGDQAAVREVHLAAFGAHGPKVAALNDDLRDTLATRPGLSLVAVDAGAVVAHVMFTRSLLDAPRQLVDVQVLSPVAVAPEHQIPQAFAAHP